VLSFGPPRCGQRMSKSWLSLENKTRGLLIGIAIGDAKGLAFEGFSREQILEWEEATKEIYSKPKPPDYKDVHPGQWSDDTQLSIAIVKSLIDAGKFDLTAIAKAHVEALKETTLGWGRGTKAAVERLANGVPPSESGSKEAAGNGVVMKLAPLAFYYSCLSETAVSTEEKLKNVEALARMTHNNAMSVATACFYVTVVERLFRDAHRNVITADRGEYTDILSTPAGRRKFLSECIPVAKEMEHRFDQKEHLFSKRLEQLLLSFDDLTDDTLISLSRGGRGFVVDSLTMVFGILVQQKPSFSSVLKAATIGGDTDSNAAMIGGILGGMRGVTLFPPEYIQHLHQANDILALAEYFCGSIMANEHFYYPVDVVSSGNNAVVTHKLLDSTTVFLIGGALIAIGLFTIWKILKK